MKCLLPSRVASSISILVLSCITLACGGGSNTTAVPTATITQTRNPLVAQVAVLSHCAGTASVEFGPDLSYGRSTAWYPVEGGYHQGLSILVAGMRASTTYHMRPQVQCGGSTTAGPDFTFQTGSLPSYPFPTMTVTRPNPSLSSTENPGIESVDIVSPTSNQLQAFFADRDGNGIWYYDVGPSGNYPFTMKLLPNGHVILSISTTGATTLDEATSILREVDLAGTTIREMDVNALAQKIQSTGFGFVPVAYHHDILPMDNGHLIVLTNVYKTFTDLPGYPGTTQVLGDAIVDLDENWNPVWAWNDFDHLDVNRHLSGLPDWTHSNALVYSPDDGNLLVSMRHQSWILKIDYNNGAGTGNVLWRLGYLGDFALTKGSVPTTDPGEWFSFQHYPSIIAQNGAQTTLAIWDNGDFRVTDTSGTVCGAAGTPTCYSRATIFQVDESAMVADLPWDYSPGYFSIWGGSINQLANGNMEFDINSPDSPRTLASEVQEVTQTSTPQIVWQMDFSAPMNAYRAYRVPSLYPGINWQY